MNKMISNHTPSVFSWSSILALAALGFGLTSCGVKKPPAPLYSLPGDAAFLDKKGGPAEPTAEDASMAPANGLYPLRLPTPEPSFSPSEDSTHK